MNGMKRALIGAALSVVAIGFAMQGQEPYLTVGNAAPSISGTGSDGKAHALESLTKEGSAFVVFWKERCPHNPRASALFNSLAKAYDGKAKMIGVVTATTDGAAKWAEQFQLAYPLLSDSDRKLIRDYKLTYSITTFEIGKDGKVAAVFPGYGQDAMSALNAAMAKAAGKDKAEVDLSKAPARLTWG